MDKVQFIIDGKYSSPEYSIMELLDIDQDKVFSDTEEKYEPNHNCTNESVNHCECGSMFENSTITGYTLTN